MGVLSVMRAVAAWAAYSIRRHWRALVALAMLTGMSGAVVITAVAGAGRGASVGDRLLSRVSPATLGVLPNQTGFDWDAVRSLPEVAALSEFVVTDLYVEAAGRRVELVNFPFVSPEFLTTVERPIVFAGRLPEAYDEVFVTPGFESVYGLGLGDRVTVGLPSSEGPGGPDPRGPVVEATITGVGESSWIADAPGQVGGLTTSPAFGALYREVLTTGPNGEEIGFINALVRLRNGAADVPAFEASLARVTGRADIELMRLYDIHAKFDRQVRFESRWLLAFAASALLAAAFLVGQAIARLAGTNAAELRTGRALGFTNREATLAAIVGPLLAGAVGAILAIAAAYVASRWMPIGTASYTEPDPGMHANWTVFGIGGATIVVAVAAASAFAARRTLTARRAAHPRGSRTAALVGRAGLGTPVEVGTRLALEPGRGASAVPVGPALIGSVVGVMGVVAAFSFARGVDDAVGHPERFGQVAELTTFVGYNGMTDATEGELAAYVEALRTLPDVNAASDTVTQTATFAETGTTAALWTLRPGAGELGAVTLDGHLPETADEIALAPDTLAAIGADVGDRVTLAGQLGPRQFTVSAEALVIAGPHNGYADGGYVTPDGFARMFDTFKYRMVLIDLADGLPPAATAQQIGTDMAAIDPGFAGMVPEVLTPPPEIQTLAQVRGLPLALGAFLAVLALTAIGYSLAAAVRRRAGDLAMLRALGMTRSQTRTVIASQATVLATVGLAAGVPLGLLVGVRVWRSVAGFTPFEYVTPWAAWALVLVGPVAVAAANLLAALPARRASRATVAHALRAE